VSDQFHFICVTCPVGCDIEAVVQDGQLLKAEGQACKRGVAFVQEELTNPRRMFTSTVRVRGGSLPLAPVRSSQALPKQLLLPTAALLRGLELQAPISQHQMIVHNVLDTGIDIIATRDIPALTHERPS
jgi:CxxC motif-containing protein